MTSKASLIYNSLLSDFPGALEEITVLSRNTAKVGGKDREFIISNEKGFNFDSVLNYSPELTDKNEQSPDALFLVDETLYFIEFKERKADKTDIREKIHEGIVTLYQYAVARKLMTRQEFLEVKIRYAVILRSYTRGNPGFALLEVLDATRNYFNLKNMEGLLVEKTTVRVSGKSIFELLTKVTNGAVKNIQLMNVSQDFAETFPETANILSQPAS
jgi:hypothetical protein